MKIDYSDIGKRIKTERKNINMTQEKLAELGGVSVTHISNIENGYTKLSLPVFIKIVNALGCSAEVLLCKNLDNNSVSSEMILSNLLEDCSNDERVVILSTIEALKTALRESKRKD